MAAKKQPKKLDSDKTALEVGAIFAAASLAIEQIVSKAVAARRLREDAFFKAQRAAILDVLQKTQAAAAPLIAKAVSGSYATGSKSALQWLAAFFGTSQDQAFSPADQRAVELLVQGTLDRLSQATGAMGRQAESIMREAAIAELQQIAALGGQGPGVIDEAADSLETALARAGVTKLGAELGDTKRASIRLIQVAGKNWDAQKYSELVVRTEARAAHSQATKQRLLENDRDLVQITSHSSDCDVCSDFDGEIYSISGSSQEYDALTEEPPFHPNCQHLLTPYL